MASTYFLKAGEKSVFNARPLSSYLGRRAHFLAQDDEGVERTNDYFVIEDQQIQLRKPMMPSMITLDERVIRQDCFCYLMERIALPETVK